VVLAKFNRKHNFIVRVYNSLDGSIAEPPPTRPAYAPNFQHNSAIFVSLRNRNPKTTLLTYSMITEAK
jgi:hypothetical protein